MSANKTLILLVAVAALMYLLYAAHQKWLRMRAHLHMDESGGVFDESAEAALDNLERINDPTPDDHFRMARLIDLNAHEGRIHNTHVLNNIVTHYSNMLPSEDDARDLDWFEIDQIENFAERNRKTMAARPYYGKFIDEVLQAREKKIQRKVDEAISTADSKLDAFVEYVEGNIEHKSDAQNVHDNAVNTSLNRTFHKLKQVTPLDRDEQRCFEEIRKHIADREATLGPDKVRKATHALAVCGSGAFSTALGATESQVFMLVWNRAFVPRNVAAGRSDLIKDAIVEAFADMAYSQGDTLNLVCPSGRCARMMEALVYTDSDDVLVKGVLTINHIRNDALERSNHILQETIASVSSGSADPRLVRVAKSYVDGITECAPEHEASFKQIVIDKIRDYVEQQYSDRLQPKQLEDVIKHCVMAVESI